MSETLRVLGQAAPLAATDTDLYTVSAGNMATVSTLTVCNRGASNATFRVAVRPGGAVLANLHYIYYEANIGANVTVAITIGMTLAAADVLTVRGSSADLSFCAFGAEAF